MGMRRKSEADKTSISATRCARQIPLALALGFLALILPGCGNDEIEATNKLVQQQQAQLEQQQQEIDALKANQQTYTPGVGTNSAGGCDKEVEQIANKRGGDKFVTGDYAKALGYYRDALLACPTDDRASVNVARTYEALGNKTQAIKYYRQAADRSDASAPTVSDASEEAKAALLRLQASRMP
jgi:tetratricopeptide (TPR) repeat protein